MVWIAVGLGLALLWWILSRPRINSKRQAVEVLDTRIEAMKRRAESLAPNERTEMVAEARRLAFAGYDRVSEAALSAGKPEAFAHQAGILDAAYCVLANDNSLRQDDNIRRHLQMEIAPFNLVLGSQGRSAIAEYLVWKIFPGDADLSKVAPVIESFADKVLSDSDGQPDSDAFIYSMLMSEKYDWQKLAVLAVKKRTEAKNG